MPKTQEGGILEPQNRNYCATVVAIGRLIDLDGCDNVKGAYIYGNQVIVGNDTREGDIGLFFPLETQLSHEFVASNSLYKKPEWGNADSNKKGFFEQSRRVRCCKFRGHRSEGFWIPMSELYGVLLKPGMEFDRIGTHPICNKYVIKTNEPGDNFKKQKKAVARFDRLVDGQFRLHYDTEQLKRNLEKINPNDIISISDKWHGTSWVVGNVLVNRRLSVVEHIAKWLGAKIKEQEYDIVYSSRSIIKNRYINKVQGDGFYGEDLWKDICEQVKERIPQGFTLYGEAVGYTHGGKWIQKGYHYGCRRGEFKTVVYRVTFTNPQGQVYELSWPEMKEFCLDHGLEMVKEFYYGFAEPNSLERKLFKDIDAKQELDEWRNGFIQKLSSVYLEKKCKYNNGEVPNEGIVIRLDRLHQSHAFKLKSFAFLNRETELLDKGESDMESEA